MLYLMTNIAAMVLYLCASGYLLMLFAKKQPLSQPWLFALGGCAVALHGVGIFHLIVTPTGIDLTISKVFSLIMMSINAIVLISCLRKALHNLLMALLPISAIAILLSFVFANNTASITPLTLGIGSHVLLSLVAYCLLAIATLQALILQWQNYHLKQRQLNGLIRHLPPLQTMEALMFEMVWAGVILLGVGIVVGALYIENMFAQHLAHKTALSILAWCIFAFLLLGRHLWGWRGSIAIRWVLGGFCMLMLAYFGSKLVLEVILP